MVLGSILDFLFPKKCVGCQKEGIWFCQECLSKIVFQDTPFIRLSSFGIEGIIAVGYFKNPLKEAIHAFKYDKIKELVQPLSDLLVHHLKDARLQFVRKSILIPVPLYKGKEIERGFNQASLLAEEVSKKLNSQILKDDLVKIKNTSAQINLKKEERRKNIKGAFAFTGDKNLIKGKGVLLIDDVMTTGATLNECAKILKKSGAGKVWGLVLAKD